MSSTSCNPGRWLRFEARLELVGADEHLVIERLEPGAGARMVELAELLQAFRVDPSDPIIGRVVITIEPA